MTTNQLYNPAVPNNNEVDTLLIEKFTGVVHEQYLKGENLLSYFDVQDVVGTNMVSNKSIGETELQVLVPGTTPKATPTETNKNALRVDTMILARAAMHMLHDVQNDFKAMSKLASNQTGKLKTLEDQMVVQQLLAGALTGGAFDPYTNEITGGEQRVSGHGVAINVELNSDLSQANDPYQLVSSIDIAIMGLIIQRVPIQGIKVIVPINEFGMLVDYGFIASVEGGANETSGMTLAGMKGTLKSWGVPIMSSVEFTQMKINPHGGLTHHLLSTADNGYRYDVSADMLVAHAAVFGPDALLCGRTMSLSSDIFFDKKDKTNYVDSWFMEGAIPDRYDNLAMVASTGTGDNAAVLTKAKGKSKATKVYA